MKSKSVPNYIENMGKKELVNFLEEFVATIVCDESEEITQEMHDFICLQQKIITELSRQRIYKVSNVDMSDFARTGVKEYQTEYFSSLNAAKRELKKRFLQQKVHPFVAAPDEIQDIGLADGVKPSLVQSVVSNSAVPLRAPTRYKFYEVRMLQDNQIIPVQFMLTSIDPIPAAFPLAKRKANGSKENLEILKKGLVIPFDKLRKK